MSVAGELWNCDAAFENRCPRQWKSLERTENNVVRFCQECQQQVTFCATPEEFVRLGNAGQCVAVPDAYSPDTLNLMFMGRPSPQAVRQLEEEQQCTAEWWADAIARRPEFSRDEIASVAKTLELRNRRAPELSPEFRRYMIEFDNAIREGPEALYLVVRTRPSGTRENQQNIFKLMRRHFELTFREFKQLASRLDEFHPR